MQYELTIYAEETPQLSDVAWSPTLSVYRPRADVRPKLAVFVTDYQYASNFNTGVVRPGIVYRFGADPTISAGVVITPKSGNVVLVLDSYEDIQNIRFKSLAFEAPYAGLSWPQTFSAYYLR